MVDYSKLAFLTPQTNNFKEYARSPATISITGTVTSGNTATFSADTTLSVDDSITMVDFSTSVNSIFHRTGRFYRLAEGSQIAHSNGSTPTLPGTANYIVFFACELSTALLTLKVLVFNPNADTLTLVDETLAFDVYSVIAPWQ